MKLQPKNIARLQILNYIISFCTVKCFGPYDGKISFSMSDEKNSFHGGFGSDTPDTPIGSLIMLQAAPTSKYYLGWLKEIRFNGWKEYLVESIEDGDLCWWSNVGVWNLPLETSNKYPEWKWTDKQFGFKKRWINACKSSTEFYQIKPMMPIFTDNGGVILRTREKWSATDTFKSEKTFDNWKKVTRKEMLEFFDSKSK